MKKIGLVSLAFFVTANLFSQSSIYFVSTNPSNTSTLSVISNGGTYTINTTPNSQDVPAKFRIYNIGSSTYTYNVMRTIKTINTQGVNTATTYFCVGATCLPPSANTLTNPGDYISIDPNNYDLFISYFSELSTIGYSEVYYKIFNVNNPNDTLSFTMKFNSTLSVEENKSMLENISVFPLPAKNNLTVLAHVNYPAPVNIELFNVLGQKVLNYSTFAAESTFKKNIDVSNIPSGVYFLKISNSSSNQNIITKKIVID